ncbi:DUF6313 family protein [Streptomyces sp. NBC_01803]|uniref:DUF6313 family protein n=1 Tax=Streptomyces sp. NBC_01803 TaxID=2975946 RepID=UPI002DD8615B|nr:DUF6313 family protein [Streptomyces sp. NBC_01803]WSA43715.1 DUF6313 family protein [Streptomyces sp. NBC_01803]
MTASALPPPPPPGVARRLRLWWVSRDALPSLPRWMLLRAGPFLLATVMLYIGNGVLIGWAGAYNVLVGITSPADADPQWCAWPLSLAGWALLPALIGGVVGYLVSAQIEAHRSRDLAEILAELRDQAGAAGPESG